ncbi:MAG: 16S rRNA processing protein RimM [Anaerolineae bacterium]|nr:16S rRNA processing protein RimM [Anaerolineae bacterium]
MPDKQPEPRYLAVGRILRPHGITGELRAQILTDYPERLVRLRHLYVGAAYRRHAVQSVRFHQNLALLRLADITDRDTAETLRGQVVWVALADAAPLEEGEYYLHQLIGMQVSTEAGEALGEIVEVLDMPGANDVYVVHGLRGEVLIPAIREVILSIDMEARQMVIHPLPGLLTDEE